MPMEDVLKSSIGIPTEGYLHQLYYYYPIEGGYEQIVHGFAKRVRGAVRPSFVVREVRRDAGRWVINGERTYDDLVSTMPIHELLRVWRDAPAAARETAAKLRYNSLINVVIGVNEDRGYPWTALYVPDREI